MLFVYLVPPTARLLVEEFCEAEYEKTMNYTTYCSRQGVTISISPLWCAMSSKDEKARSWCTICNIAQQLLIGLSARYCKNLCVNEHLKVRVAINSKEVYSAYFDPENFVADDYYSSRDVLEIPMKEVREIEIEADGEGYDCDESDGRYTYVLRCMRFGIYLLCYESCRCS